MERLLMLTCREVTDFLMAYLDGELSEETVAEFEGHLAICPPCVAYMKTYRRTVEMGKAAFADPDAEVPEEVPEKLVKAILSARKKK